MNKDTKWLLFDCHEDEFGFVTGKGIEWYTELRPIGYDNIGDFLDARKAPKHRKHIAEMLKKYGCESIENFLKSTHALSLNDTFWVKEPESPLSGTKSPYIATSLINRFLTRLSTVSFLQPRWLRRLPNSERTVRMLSAGRGKKARPISTKAAVTPTKLNHCPNFSPPRWLTFFAETTSSTSSLSITGDWRQDANCLPVSSLA